MHLRPCAGSLGLGLILASVATAGDVRAEPFMGTDTGAARTIRSLYEKGVHAEVSAGLWYATLTRGFTGLADSMQESTGDTSAVTKANKSIGAGRGLVREINIGVSVEGNEAFFDYLSDELLQAAEEEEGAGGVRDPQAKQVIRQIIGELRPNLRSILGPDAKMWVRSEYGKLQGELENAHLFASRNGQPYFGSRNEGWQTKHFGLELGVFANPGKSSEGSSALLGLYGRYRRFSRPLVLGWSSHETTSFMLQDGTVTAIDVGVRGQLRSCSKHLCTEFDGSLSPFLGFTQIDVGRYGTARGGLVTAGGNLRLAVPLQLSPNTFVGPYVGVRLDLLVPAIVTPHTDPNAPSLWPTDYLFTGPTLGVTGKI